MRASLGDSLASRLSSTLYALEERDVRLFDNVVAHLADNHASDLASLRAAYHAVVHDDQGPSKCPDGDARDDLHFDLMLSMLKVRGDNWRQRWDAVRVALGLEPIDVTNTTTASESSGDEADYPPRPRVRAALAAQHRLGQRGGSVAASLVDRSATVPPRQRTKTMTVVETTLEPLRRRAALLAKLSEQPDLKSRGATALPPRTPYVDGEDRENDVDGSLSRPPSYERVVGGKEEAGRVERLTTTSVTPATGGAGGKRRRDDKGRLPRHHDPRPATDDRRPRQSTSPGVRIEATPASRRRDSTSRSFESMLERARAERRAIDAAREAALEAEELARWAPQMEEAQSFFRTSLLRTCLGWWRRAWRAHATRERRAAAARDEVVLARAWERWRCARLAWRERERDAVAEGERRVRSQVWRRWGEALEQRRERRKEARREQLRRAWDELRRRRRERLTREAWQHWKRRRQSVMAERVRRRALLRGGFHLWRLRADHARCQRSSLRRFVRAAEARTRRRAWERWRQRRALVRNEHVVAWRRNDGALRHAWSVWRLRSSLSTRLYHHETRVTMAKSLARWRDAALVARRRREAHERAETWHEERCRRRALTQWSRRLSHLVGLHRSAEELRRRREARLAWRALRTWTSREREALLVRVHDARRTSAALGVWRQRFLHVSMQLAARCHGVCEARDGRALRRGFARWRARWEARRDEADRADATWESSTSRRSWSRWRSVLDAHRQRLARAERVADELRRQGAWTAWRERRRERLLSDAVWEKEQRRMASCLGTWRRRCEERKRRRLEVAAFRARGDERAARMALQRWTSAVVRRKEEEIEAQETRDAKLLRLAWARWRARRETLLQLDMVADGMQMQRDSQTMRDALDSWRWSVHRRRELRRCEAELSSWQVSARTATCFERWYERLRDARLRPVEYEMTSRHKDRVAMGILQHWQERTALLPAIRLDHARLREAVLQRWREQLPRARMTHEAARVERRALLAKAFGHWAGWTKSRRSIRAAVRFGGPSAARLRSASHTSPRSPFVRRTKPRSSSSSAAAGAGAAGAAAASGGVVGHRGEGEGGSDGDVDDGTVVAPRRARPATPSAPPAGFGDARGPTLVDELGGRRRARVFEDRETDEADEHGAGASRRRNEELQKWISGVRPWSSTQDVVSAAVDDFQGRDRGAGRAQDGSYAARHKAGLLRRAQQPDVEADPRARGHADDDEEGPPGTTTLSSPAVRAAMRRHATRARHGGGLAARADRGETRGGEGRSEERRRPASVGKARFTREEEAAPVETTASPQPAASSRLSLSSGYTARPSHRVAAETRAA